MELVKYKGRICLGSLPDDTGWWTKEDWDNHEKYVKELEASGELGKEVEIEMSLVPNPLFDKSLIIDSPIESWRMVFLDFGKKD